MLLKNTAQKIHVYAYDTTTGAPKTGDAANITGSVSLDGTRNAIDDTNPDEVDATNMPGIYSFNLTAAETNCDSFALVAKSSTSNVRIEPIIGYTTAIVPGDSSGVSELLTRIPDATPGDAGGLPVLDSDLSVLTDDDFAAMAQAVVGEVIIPAE
jgi:hypothetical protein